MKKKIENLECQQRFGELIRAERKRKGLRQEDVALLLGMTKSYYGHIERGERNVDFVLAIEISQALGFDLSEFIKQYI